jgi:hypothetical protein
MADWLQDSSGPRLEQNRLPTTPGVLRTLAKYDSLLEFERVAREAKSAAISNSVMLNFRPGGLDGGQEKPILLGESHPQ